MVRRTRAMRERLALLGALALGTCAWMAARGLAQVRGEPTATRAELRREHVREGPVTAALVALAPPVRRLPPRGPSLCGRRRPRPMSQASADLHEAWRAVMDDLEDATLVAVATVEIPGEWLDARDPVSGLPPR